MPSKMRLCSVDQLPAISKTLKPSKITLVASSAFKITTLRPTTSSVSLDGASMLLHNKNTGCSEIHGAPSGESTALQRSALARIWCSSKISAHGLHLSIPGLIWMSILLQRLNKPTPLMTRLYTLSLSQHTTLLLKRLTSLNKASCQKLTRVAVECKTTSKVVKSSLDHFLGRDTMLQLFHQPLTGG